MHIGRPLLTFLVAASVALLPFTGGMAMASTPVPTAQATMMSMPDCCDPDDGMPMDHTSMNDIMRNDCQANAGCAAKCFTLYPIIFCGSILHPPAANVEPSPLTYHLRSQVGTPPFRPPRV